MGGCTCICVFVCLSTFADLGAAQKEEELRSIRVAPLSPAPPANGATAMNGHAHSRINAAHSHHEQQLREMHAKAVARYNAQRETLSERRKAVEAELSSLAAPLTYVQ